MAEWMFNDTPAISPQATYGPLVDSDRPMYRKVNWVLQNNHIF